MLENELLPEELNPGSPVINSKDWTGIWIPKKIIYDHNLTYSEKMLLSLIWSLDGEHNCYASNKYLAEVMGLNERTLANIIVSLKKKNYIKQISWNGKIRRMTVIVEMH